MHEDGDGQRQNQSNGAGHRLAVFQCGREQDEIAKDYAKTFLLIAPNVIVLERLKGDFANGKIFREDPIRPKEFEIFWDFDCVMRGEGERAYSEGVLFLTNIQQFYERAGAGQG